MRKLVIAICLVSSWITTAAAQSTTTISVTPFFGGAYGTVTTSVSAGNCMQTDGQEGEGYSSVYMAGYQLFENPGTSASGQNNPALTFIGPGTYTATGYWTGYQGQDPNGNGCTVAGSSATQIVTVPQYNSAIIIQPPTQTLQAGQALTIPIILDNGDGAGYGPTPTGAITLYCKGPRFTAFPGATPYTFTISQPTDGVPPGTYQAYIGYAGDSNFTPVNSSPFTITIESAQQATSTTVTVAPNPVVKGNTVALSAVVTPTGQVAPTGTVTLLASGTKVATIPVANGAGSISIPANIAPGTYNIQALYSGDSFNLPSTSSPVSVTVVAQTATTTTVSVTPTTIIAGQTAQISANVTPQIGDSPPSGTLTITANGRTVTTIPLQNGLASLNFSTNGVPAGTYNVIGTYSGSATATSSTSAPQTVVIVPASTVALTASPNPVNQGSITTLTAVVKTGSGTPVTSGTITFSYGGNSLGTATLNSSGTAQLPIATSSFAAGTYTIQASYPGSGNIPAATGSVPLVVN
jgi:hypothetical protein